jgi:hypothetical protein
MIDLIMLDLDCTVADHGRDDDTSYCALMPVSHHVTDGRQTMDDDTLAPCVLVYIVPGVPTYNSRSTKY